MYGVKMHVRRSEDNLRCWNFLFTMYEERSPCCSLLCTTDKLAFQSLGGLLTLGDIIQKEITEEPHATMPYMGSGDWN